MNSTPDSRLPRIVYVSSTPLGEQMLELLRTMPCGIVLAETGNVRVTEFPEYDLAISFLYTYRIPASELDPPYRWVNFHPGPLPEFRGRNIAYHAIMNGAESFGGTLHYMDAEFDTGEIIDVERFRIEPWHTAGDLVTNAYRSLRILFERWIGRLLEGRVPSVPQQGGTYYKREPIDELVALGDEQRLKIRALTVAPRFWPLVEIGGKRYRMRLEEVGED